MVCGCGCSVREDENAEKGAPQGINTGMKGFQTAEVSFLWCGSIDEPFQSVPKKFMAKCMQRVSQKEIQQPHPFVLLHDSFEVSAIGPVCHRGNI